MDLRIDLDADYWRMKLPYELFINWYIFCLTILSLIKFYPTKKQMFIKGLNLQT